MSLCLHIRGVFMQTRVVPRGCIDLPRWAQTCVMFASVAPSRL